MPRTWSRLWPNYGQLDRAGAPIRLRLSSIAIRAGTSGDPAAFRPRGRDHLSCAAWNALTRRAPAAAVLAGYNAMIPYLCPEQPSSRRTEPCTSECPRRRWSIPKRRLAQSARAFDALKDSSGVRALAPTTPYFHLNPHVNIGCLPQSLGARERPHPLQGTWRARPASTDCRETADGQQRRPGGSCWPPRSRIFERSHPRAARPPYRLERRRLTPARRISLARDHGQPLASRLCRGIQPCCSIRMYRSPSSRT